MNTPDPPARRSPCMLLFGAAAAQRQLPAGRAQADALHNDSPTTRGCRDEEYSRERGPILVARQGRSPAARKSNDRLKYLRAYTDGRCTPPLTGFYSLRLRRDRASSTSQNSILAGTDDAAVRPPDHRPARPAAQPKGGSVALTINPEAQKAAYDGLRALGDDRQGAVVALDPQHRRDPRDGQHPVVRPEPAGQPRPGEVPARPTTRLSARPVPPMLNRAHPGDLPARLDASSWSPRRPR